MWLLLGGLWMGWALGANDAANVMGTAVATRMLRFRVATGLAAAFVLLGAICEGHTGFATYAGLTGLGLEDAVVASVGAVLTTIVLGHFGLPISTSQAVVGAIFCMGLLNREVNAAGFGKIVACWVGTPIGAALVAAVLYEVLGAVYNRLRLNLFRADAFLRVGLLGATAYGAYVLGGNNVANVTGVFVGAGYLGNGQAALLGGLSIAAGILTCQRQVMDTVGKGLVRLNPFSALVVVLAEALTVHFYTQVGVPVSTSQAVVGALLGVGLVRGSQTVRLRALAAIGFGWLITPVLGGLFALLTHLLIHLRYVPTP